MWGVRIEEVMYFYHFYMVDFEALLFLTACTAMQQKRSLVASNLILNRMNHGVELWTYLSRFRSIYEICVPFQICYSDTDTASADVL